MVAWTPTRESARALHDALPLLHAASSVDLLELDPAAEQSGADGQPITDVAMPLERHGLKVTLITRHRQAQSVASALLGYAEYSDADLLVAGGYGHSRLRARQRPPGALPGAVLPAEPGRRRLPRLYTGHRRRTPHSGALDDLLGE